MEGKCEAKNNDNTGCIIVAILVMFFLIGQGLSELGSKVDRIESDIKELKATNK